MERTIGLSNMRLQEMDLRLQCVETASYNGVLIWKIRDFRRRKQEAVSGRTVSLYSQPFYTSRYGYKACARIYLNGDGMGKGTHMSLFFVILRGDFDALLPWPFRQKVTMTLIDHDGKKNIVDSFRADPTSNSFKRPSTDMNIASGCPLFAPLSTVESNTYLRDDCIFMKIHVDTAELKDASFDAKSGTF
jgi:TNF receptor-associated factor 3